MLHLKHGGIEKQTITMSNALANYYEIEIVSLYNFNNFIAYDLDPRIKVKYLLNWGSNKKEFLQAFKRKDIISLFKEGFKATKILLNKKRVLKNYLKKCNSDIIFSTRIEFANILSACHKKDAITITQEHNHIDNVKYARYVKKATQNIDYIVVMSKIAYDLYSSWVKDNQTKVVIIPNILDNIPKEKAKLEDNNLIAVGRLHPVKNYSELLDVFKLVYEKKRDTRLYIVGDGEERAKLENKAISLGLKDAIIFTGMVSSSEVQKYMLNASLFVMTSISECFPMVLLEANACGLPVISFDVPAGPQTIIKDEVNGFLIPNHQDEEMAQRIVDYLNNKKLKKQMGLNAKEMAKNYLGDKIVVKWLELLGGDNK